MDIKIKGGAPTSTSDINLWNSSAASVITDTSYGKVYNIRPNGFMSQFIYSAMYSSSIKLTIDYKLIGIKETYILIKMLGAGNSYTRVMLSPTSVYRRLEIDIPMPEGSIDSVSIEINNISDSSLQVAFIDISGVSSVSSMEIDVNQFANIAILYGSDANKPKLR